MSPFNLCKQSPKGHWSGKRRHAKGPEPFLYHHTAHGPVWVVIGRRCQNREFFHQLAVWEPYSFARNHPAVSINGRCLPGISGFLKNMIGCFNAIVSIHAFPVAGNIRTKPVFVSRRDDRVHAGSVILENARNDELFVNQNGNRSS